MRSVPRKDGGPLCFTEASNGKYRLKPLYYVTDSDKQWYKDYYKIRYSDAYEIYELKRTGCCGCSISASAVKDLEKIEPFEPNLVKAAWNVFEESYRYRQKYNEYKEKRKQGETKMQKNEKICTITESRMQIIAQSNDFIRHSRTKMTAKELDIIYFLFSKVKPKDKDFNVVEIELGELCKILGIEITGKNYNNLKKSLKTLSDKSAWIEYSENEGTTEKLIRWVDTYEIKKGSGLIKAHLSQSLKPFLLNLIKYGFYTQTEFIYFIALRTGYSKRLYEILRTHIIMKVEQAYRYQFKKYTLEELRELLSAQMYLKYFDLKRRVLEPSVKEINLKTDVEVTYNEIKKGREIIFIEFVIKLKNVDERFNKIHEINNKLGHTEKEAKNVL